MTDPDVVFKIAKVAIISPAGEVLLLRRADHDEHRPGELDLPGGTVEDGEEFVQAAIREVWEEIGVRLTPADLVSHIERTGLDPRRNKVMTKHMFVVRLGTLPVLTLSPEHADHYWMPREEAVAAFAHPVWGLGLAILDLDD